ncbi:MAG: TylF/MycF/NovP-related O-methyltransferase [Acidobacteriaceae bacterium]
MARIFSSSFRKNLKSVLYRRYRLIILRGQVVLDMEKMADLSTRDSLRVCSLHAIADEISARAVKGSVAELGVYQGHFAKDINAVFPDRNLYLFDTFAGFHEQDKKIDIHGGYSSAAEDFSDTSVDLVMAKMKHPEKVTIRAGYFPESLQEMDEQERFAFVSIDTDLYKPIYDGLQFFYPRLNPGGYIFVHDYNNKDYPGVNAAVRKYCEEENINCFPLVDPCGTGVIAKG